MTVPIYILGFLMRFGSMHGYKLKQLISRQVADFTQIKLLSIYYHLEKMEKKEIIWSWQYNEGNPFIWPYRPTTNKKNKIRRNKK